MYNLTIEEITFEEGKTMNRYRVDSFGDLSISILDYGLTIETLKYKGINRVLTLKEPKDYFSNKHFVGSTIGRVAGRVSKALLKIDGQEYPLDKNEGNNCLHGGFEGFSKKKWHYLGSSLITEGKEEEISIEFSLASEDGEGGFPGNLDVKARFRIGKKGKLIIEYFAKTDQKTPITITNHSYFNLNTDPTRTIENHQLQISSKEYLQLNEYKIPTTFRSVRESPFDLQEKKNLGVALNELKSMGLEGFDHPFIFTEEKKDLQLLCDDSNTRLVINTTDPCAVVYSGNQINNELQFKDGGQGKRFQGICLETQWFPNAVNTDFLPKNYFTPEEAYYSRTTYQFEHYEK